MRIGRTEKIWTALIVTAPIGFLSVLNWSAALLLVLAVFSCWVLWRRTPTHLSAVTAASRWHLAVFIFPILAVGISQALRLEGHSPDFDAPSRLLIASVIYLALWHSRFSPQTAVLALIAGIALSVPSAWLGMTSEAISGWGNRFATPSSDTNAFGSFMGLFVCMLSAAYLLRGPCKSKGAEVLYAIGCFATIASAVYLLLGTFGRAAWLSTALGLMVVGGVVTYARPPGWRPRFLFLVTTPVLALAAISFLDPDFLARVFGRAQSVAVEVTGWHQGLERDSSGGMRLEMNAAAFDLFLHAPVTGFGDLRHAQLAREPWMTTKYSEALIHMLTTAGPHSEFWGRTLQSGIWGSIAVGCFFVIPLVTFARVLRRRTVEAGFVGGVGLVAIFYLGTVSFSNEFTLKYIASFNGFLMAVLLASAANLLRSDSEAAPPQSAGRAGDIGAIGS